MARGKIIYSDRQIDEFIEVAQENGIGPAMRQLQYPGSAATARKWFNMRGAEIPTVDSLMARAVELKVFYSDKEKKLVAMTALDRIMEQLETKELTPDDLNKIANALSKIVQTFNLIEGKATTISESHTKDGADLGLIDILNEQKAKNAAREAGINGA